MSVMVFGHKSPDTDSTGSPIIWAWYLKHVKNIDTEPVLLGQPNSEALFMLDYWGIEKPQIIDNLDSGSSVVIVIPITLMNYLKILMTARFRQ